MFGTNPRTKLYFEPGGFLPDYEKRWKALAESGDTVEIRGYCNSACTMIMAYVPSEKICFSESASLGFHSAQVNGKLDLEVTTKMLRSCTHKSLLFR
jgi:hypothetical protein